MFDVFYIGSKAPRLFVHERAADSIEQARVLSHTRYCWIVSYLADYTGFDFLWEPPPWQSSQRHAWASQWQRDSGTYLVPKTGFQDTNYHDAPVIARLSDRSLWQVPADLADTFDYSWHPDPADPPMTYQFGTQWQKTGGPRYVIPGGNMVKYITEPRCVRNKVDPYWHIPNGVNTDSFDWTWHPDATEQPWIYQFGTQWQKTGGPTYTMPGATDVKYVDQLHIRSERTASAVYLIDHLDNNINLVRDQISVNRTVRYFDNYLDTLRRIAKNAPAEQEFIWIISSVCDYSDFDFSWHPEQWQASMLHVFASGDEKFGDTFFMHVPTFAYRSDTCQLLEWYDINFVQDRSVPRRLLPVVHHDRDSQADAVKTHVWPGPLALFTTKDSIVDTSVVVPLWREHTRTIVPLSDGATAVIVPRSAIPYIKTQLYDYPYIDRSRKFFKDEVLDIVFISNGEHGADHHWQMLNTAVSNFKNHVHRVDGINGRVAAYRAAAQASTTPWFFAVFAKLQVNADFDWSWQPDRMQQAKHYIFHAYNPVNHLVYGHQAMIAYNVNLVLANPGRGLDFTLDDPHEVVPIVSGTAYYDNDPWTCWRTAFRECIKLRYSLPDVENEYRLAEWLSKGDGSNGIWSLRGAQDAVRYYEDVKGDFAEIKKSYEWLWLAAYAMMVQPELVTQSRT